MVFIGLFFYLFCVNCAKEICFSASYMYCSGTLIKDVNEETNFEEEITKNIDDTVTDVSIILNADLEFKFPLKIFNNKALSIELRSTSRGTFDVTEIQNINIKISTTSYTDMSQIQFEGSSLNDDQTSLDLVGIQLTFNVEEIRLKSFSYERSEFSFSKMTLNSFVYQINDDYELTLSENDLIFDGKTVIFSGTNQSLTLKSSTTSYDLIFNNQATSGLSITNFIFESMKSITFNGIEFSESTTLSFSNCLIINSNVGFLPISSFKTSSSYSNIHFIASKSLTIKGSISIASSSILNLTTSDGCSSRITVSIDSITFLNYYSCTIQFSSSWIDLICQSLTIPTGSYSKIPIYPCIGSGGCSTATFNSIEYNSQSKLSFNSLTVKFDVSGEQTDETLANLMSKDWDVIVFKSFSTVSQVDKFTSITYDPSTINGFQSSASILTASSTVSDDYVVSFSATSYKLLPLFFCYTTSTSCAGGTAIDDISNLADLIPDYAKQVNLTLSKNLDELDLSLLNTKGATFTVTVSSSMNYYIKSIKMDDFSEDAKIDHLVFNKVAFDTGSFQLNSKEITFTDCKVSSSAQPSLSFNEQSIVNIDKTSITNLISYVSNSFPLTKITGIDSYSFKSFEITETEYYCHGSSSYYDYRISRDKLPVVVFRVNIGSSSDLSIAYTISTSSIGSVTLQISSDFDTNKLSINFQNLETIETAEKIGIQNVNFAQTTIDLNNFALKSFFEFTGNNIEIINQGVSSDSNLCICKDDQCSLCDEGTAQISFDQLSQKLQSISDDLIVITVVGSGDENSPVISFADIKDKNAKIFGIGTDPKIKIDCSTEFQSESFVEFSSIEIIPQSLAENLHISNFKMDKDCKLDSSFNQIQLTVDSLICDISNLVFKSVLVQKSLILEGNEVNSESTTKVSFSEDSSFEYSLPNTITFNGPKLLIGNTEFDLTGISPSLSISEEITEFNIIGDNGNIDDVGSNIVFSKLNSLESLHISGTWINENPTKFIVFNDFGSDLYLQSENIPVNIMFSQPKNIILQSEIISIKGTLSFGASSSYLPNYTITATKTEKVTFTVDTVVSTSSYYTSKIEFKSSNIDMVINTMTSDYSSIEIQFYLLISINDFNKIEVINKIDKSSLFKYEVTCIVTGSLKDQNVKDFIKTNRTLIVLNEENTVRSSSSIYFGDNVPAGFNSNNFKLVVNNNQLIFFNLISPYEADVSLYYGSCYGSSATQISADDLSHIERFVQVDDANVTITFCSSIISGNVLDLSNEQISIHSLNLIGSSYSGNIVPIKFCSNIANLNVQKITLRVSEDNEEYTIQNTTLKDSSSFSEPSSYSHLLCLNVDRSSLFISGITEFTNDFNIYIDSSSSLIINYTATGIKLIDSQTQIFDIDVEKFPKTNLIINSKTSPVINLEENVQELKQINSLVLDSTTINIGSNWNQLKDSKSKVQYSLNNQDGDILIITESFPFESWDLMFKYKIAFSTELYPYSFTDKITLNNQSIILTTTIDGLSSYSVTFDDVLITGEASITCISSSSRAVLSIEKLLVQQGNATFSNVHLTNEITLDADSSLNGQFSIDESLSLINIEWDLDKAALVNPSNEQNFVPKEIYIIYKGSSIEGREKLFDEFLSKGVLIMNNIVSDLSNSFHFQSENELAFSDGEELALKTQVINENEIQLISTRLLYVPDEVTSSELAEESSSIEEPSSEEQSISLEESNSQFVSNSIEESSSEEQSISIEQSSSEIESVSPIESHSIEESSLEIVSNSIEESSLEIVSNSIDESSLEIVSNSVEESSSEKQSISIEQSSSEIETHSIEESSLEIESNSIEESSSEEQSISIEQSSSEIESVSPNESNSIEESSSEEQSISIEQSSSEIETHSIEESSLEIESNSIEESNSQFESYSEIESNVEITSNSESSISNSEFLSETISILSSSQTTIQTPSITFSPEFTTGEHPQPTQTPLIIEPIIDDSFTTDSNFIEFVENGFNNGTFISTEESKSDILLIKSNSNRIYLRTTETAKSESFLFVSPQQINTVLSISSPSEGKEDYGRGQFGIHANSKNPIVDLPLFKVPLNIFNDEESITKFVFNTRNTRNLNLLDTNQVLLKKLTISKGVLQLDLPNGITEIGFDEVETFLNGKLVTKDFEASIESLKMNAGSNFHISSVKFNKGLTINENSNLFIEGKATFNEFSSIEISDSSFIEFGDSTIEGTCQEIKLKQKDSTENNRKLNDSESEFESFSENEDEEINYNLICGSKFDCANWKTKYNATDSFYKYAKCTVYENSDKICLTLTNKAEISKQTSKKNGLSKGIIAAIVIVVVVVVIAIITGIIIYSKKSRYEIESVPNDEDYSVSL